MTNVPVLSTAGRLPSIDVHFGPIKGFFLFVFNEFVCFFIKSSPRAWEIDSVFSFYKCHPLREPLPGQPFLKWQLSPSLNINTPSLPLSLLSSLSSPNASPLIRLTRVSLFSERLPSSLECKVHEGGNFVVAHCSVPKPGSVAYYVQWMFAE